MYINRMLVLTLLIILLCYPVLRDWLSNDHAAWYRYYLLWGAVIVVTWWSNRSRHPDEL